jgi:hypothetical protein
MEIFFLPSLPGSLSAVAEVVAVSFITMRVHRWPAAVFLTYG